MAHLKNNYNDVRPDDGHQLSAELVRVDVLHQRRQDVLLGNAEEQE